MEDRWDVLVVGGGPAGAIASYLLKQRYSRRVLLLEKETFPRLKPCAGGIAPRTELVGDAARCINSYTGEGISYAVESGMIAAECIAVSLYIQPCITPFLRPFFQNTGYGKTHPPDDDKDEGVEKHIY